ncbi:MAG: E3 ubiquitin protein ligase [archaeon]|nr:E3 ubiquitin protein ligase [archaeon]
MSIFLFLLLISVSLNARHSPESVYEFYLKENSLENSENILAKKIIDPDNFISNKEKILDKVEEMQTETNFNFVIIILGSVKSSFLEKEKSLDKFTKDFINLIYEKRPSVLENTIAITLVMDLRRIGIFCGRNVIQINSDEIQNKISSKANTNLIAFKQNYSEILLSETLNSVKDYIKDKMVGAVLEKVKGMSVFGWIITGGILLLIIIILIGCCGILKQKKRPKVDKLIAILNQMSAINDSPKQEEIFKQYCGLCFEKINEPNTDPKKEPLLSDDFHPLIVKENDNEPMSLSCGHYFHTKCYREYENKIKEIETENKSKCPYCDNDMTNLTYDELDDNQFTDKIIKYQSLICDEFKGVEITKDENGKFSYKGGYVAMAKKAANEANEKYDLKGKANELKDMALKKVNEAQEQPKTKAEPEKKTEVVNNA